MWYYILFLTLWEGHCTMIAIFIFERHIIYDYFGSVYICMYFIMDIVMYIIYFFMMWCIDDDYTCVVLTYLWCRMDAYICMCLWYVTDNFDGCMMVILVYMSYVDVFFFGFYDMHDVLFFGFSHDFEEKKDLWCLIAFVL